MKLLLDESIPRQLLNEFPESIDATTVQKMGWAGTKNGALLALAGENGFNALVTADKGIEYQHDLESLTLPVIVLLGYRTRLQDLQPFVPELLLLLERELSAGVYHIGA